MKDKICYPFYDVTLYVLILLTFFIGKGLFSSLFVFSFVGISFLGFFYNWFIETNKNKKMLKITNLLVNIAGLFILFWIGFTLKKTSFLFEEIVFVFVKAIYAILAILSFNYKNSRNPFYMRYLTLLLLLAYPILMPVDTITFKFLSVFYLCFFIVSLRFNPYESYKLNPFRTGIIFIFYLVFISFCFIIINFMKTDIPLVEMPRNYFSMRTDKFDMEDELYSLQDYLMEECLSGKSKDNNEQSKVISFLSTLFKQTPYIKEVEKSYLGLIDIFRRPGPGIEDGENDELLFRLKEYKDLKTKSKRINSRNNLLNKLIQSKIGFKNKISSLANMNKAEYSKDFKSLNSEIEKINNNIEKSNINKKDKKEIQDLVEEFKKWKTYSLYDYTRNKLGNEIKSSVNKGKKDVLDLYENLERQSNALNLCNINSKFEDILNEKLYKNFTGSEKDNLRDSFKKMIEFKIEISLEGSLEELSSEFTKQTGYEDVKKEALSIMKDIISSKESNEFYQNIKELKELSRDEEDLSKVLASDRFNNFKESKAELMFKKEKEIIKKLLKEEVIDENKKNEFIESINKIFYSEDVGMGDWGKIKSEAQKLFEDGLIYEATEKKLINSLVRISEIDEAKRLSKKVSSDKAKVDYAEDWKQIVKNISKNNNVKEEMRNLMDSLVNASTMQEVNTIKNTILEKLVELKGNPVDARLVNKLKETLGKVLIIKEKVVSTDKIANLILEFKEIKYLSEKHNESISSVLKELREVYFEEKEVSGELLDRLQSVNDEFLNKKKDLNNIGNRDNYEVFILPRKMIISKSSLSNVKVICEYSQNIIKDITSEVKWTFHGSGKIFIDKKGLIDVVALGQVMAIADYNGIKSEAIEIHVVKPLK